MIELYINGDKVDVNLEGEKTVGDVLHSFELTCEENKAAVIGITVNDTVVTADTFDEISKHELNNDKFYFTVVTEFSIKESFAKLADLFELLADKMEEVPMALQEGNNALVSESIQKVADSIDEFCHIATLATLFPATFTNTNINGKNFKEFFSDFAPVLADFEEALKNNDTVLIGDLSEYEICPRLKEISSSLKKDFVNQ